MRIKIGSLVCVHSRLELFCPSHLSSYRDLSLRSRRWKKLYSKIRIADAITVVQRPRLSPTPLWVMLVVRTILLEIR